MQLEINSLCLENYTANEIVCNVFNNEDFITDNMIGINYMKDTIKRKRKKNKNNNYQPKNFNDIPDNLKYDNNGDLFLAFDSGIEKLIGLLFFSNYKKKFIFKDLKFLIMDGTFRIALSNFYQCLVMHTVFFGENISYNIYSKFWQI
ncbi:hypothetical protein DMUE_1964 [Dictyocoela muelleri]|nr:hypothetical protein DMUE_1964 [Dictyocoela muelleri]